MGVAVVGASEKIAVVVILYGTVSTPSPNPPTILSHHLTILLVALLTILRLQVPFYCQ